MNTMDNFEEWSGMLYNDFVALFKIYSISPAVAFNFFAYFITLNMKDDFDEEDAREFCRIFYEIMMGCIESMKSFKKEN